MTSYVLDLSYGCNAPKRIKATSDAASLASATGPLGVWELDGRRPTFPMTITSADVSDGDVVRTAAADGSLGPPAPCAKSNGHLMLILVALLIVAVLFGTLAFELLLPRRPRSV